MKTSLQWLRDYLPDAPDATVCAEALTHGGLPVEVIEEVNDDRVMDVEVTSNRGDCLSHVGVARELSALLDKPFAFEFPAPAEAPERAERSIRVINQAPSLCPLYTARVIRNVTIGPSPRWMRLRLEAIGVRPINNVVDVTNYVLFEMGQPLHAFDHDKLIGATIVVRTASAGEKLMSIDGHERTLSPNLLVIADAQRPVALAGVMGGRETEVGEGTVNILLESARFDPLSVRQTARALSIKSDSSYRFERGIDPTLPPRASLRAAQLILEVAGGELLWGLVTAGEATLSPRRLVLRLPRMKQVLGVEIPAEKAMNALTRLGLGPMLDQDRITVTVPSHRLDIKQEVDLIEEVVRVVGYDRIGVKAEIAIRLTPASPEQRATQTIRQTIASCGYYEAVTVGFISDSLKDDFVPPHASGLPRTDPNVRKSDAHLRPSLIPGLLEAVRRNETAGTFDVRLFEIGQTFWLDQARKVQEHQRLAMVGPADLRDLSGAVEALLRRVDRRRSMRVVPGQAPGFDPGSCGVVHWGEAPIGVIGKVAADVADKLNLREPPAACELEMPALVAGMQHVPQLVPLPKFPAVRRDVSLIVADELPYGHVDALVRELQLQNLEDIEHVTTYRGKPLERNQKSITITLVFRSPHATLTSEEVEQSVQRMIESARVRLGATLRT